MPINANNSELIEIIGTVHNPFVSYVQQQNLHKNAIESESNVVYSLGQLCTIVSNTTFFLDKNRVSNGKFSN